MPARRLLGTTLAAALVAALLTLTGTSTPAGAATGDVTFFGDPSETVQNSYGIVGGPDGNLWFTSFATNHIVRLTPSGTYTLFPIPVADRYPFKIDVGPDGDLWFTGGDGIGRVTTTGTVTWFPLAVSSWDLAAGPDGNVWFTTDDNSIGRITPGGTTTFFTDAAISTARGITTGPDGNVWFTSYANDRIGRITPQGTISTFVDGSGNLNGPLHIISGPDGRLWAVSYDNNRIARITTAGAISSFSTGSLDEPNELTMGADGNVWVTSDSLAQVGRITTPGAITTFPTTSTFASALADGPDGDLWFTSGSDVTIGRMEVCSPGTYSDVGPTHPFRAEICWMGVEGISNGYDDGTYRPSAPVTRQAMSAFMYRLAGEPAFTSPASPTFSDVGAAHTFYDEIEWMADEGISTGYPGSPKPSYRPSDAVTRQAMSAFIYRLVGSPETGDQPPTFTDVSSTHPFFDEIEWMASKEITTGYQPGPTYRPSNPVTRQAMSAFMQRSADFVIT
jgi:virginiamycin B lyase